MNLFIDSISNPSAIISFWGQENNFSHLSVDIAMNESSKLVWYLKNFLKDSKHTIHDIENLVVVNGPGSFTWVRTTVLIANTLAYRTNITLTPISYFDLFDNFPIIKQSSKRDVFIKKTSKSEVEILSNSECIQYVLENKIKKIYWDFDIFSNMAIIKEQWEQYSKLSETLSFQDTIETVESVNYREILSWITFQKEKQIEALYIKKPNIS